MDEDTTVNASQVYSSHLGPHNNIGPFTHVRINTVTGYGVHLGAYVETKNSNFARGNTVSHLTYIGDSDVGKYCNFGCGTVTCNYDGKDKFRTQIGDYCFIGCNTNLVAPVTIGDGAYTAAGSTITKDVPPQALGIARERQTNLDGWAEPKMEAYIIKKQKLEKSRVKFSVLLPSDSAQSAGSASSAFLLPRRTFRIRAPGHFMFFVYLFARAYVIITYCSKTDPT